MFDNELQCFVSTYSWCSCSYVQWNISDYFSQNRSRICTDLPAVGDQDGDRASKVIAAGSTGGSGRDLPSGEGMPAFDALWMDLYGRLSDLCVDQRPAVRKSAGQTLFSMIAAHGALLKKSSWQTMLWKVSCLVLNWGLACSSTDSDISSSGISFFEWHVKLTIKWFVTCMVLMLVFKICFSLAVNLIILLLMYAYIVNSRHHL